MAIHFDMVSDGPLLRVTARGADDGLGAVIAYADGVAERAKRCGCTKILCDERELTYALTTMETFLAAESASHYAVSGVKIAIVCRKEYRNEAAFFETVAANRGLLLKATTDITEAEQWLNEA